MATVHNRITHLRLSFEQDTRMKIGKEICERFFSQNKKPKIFKITSVEPHGTFQVLSYPKSFIPVMDEIIRRHLPKGKRQRLNKVFSSDHDKPKK